MFQFRAFPSHGYFIYRAITGYCPVVLPHSEISGSQLICSSPKLFAACHVLHRLLMPRHSPCALISLTWRQKGLHYASPAAKRRASAPFRPFCLFGPKPKALSRFLAVDETLCFFPSSAAMNVHSFRFSNYAGPTEDVSTKLYLLPDFVPHLLSLCSRRSSRRALCCLAFLSFLCSVFKVQFPETGMVENSGIEPLTS